MGDEEEAGGEEANVPRRYRHGEYENFHNNVSRIYADYGFSLHIHAIDDLS